MAMQAVVLRFPPEDIRIFKARVASGEFTSLSDAVRILTMRGIRLKTVDELLDAIALQRKKRPVPDSFLEDLRRFRDRDLEDALKETGGDRVKAVSLMWEEADALSRKWRSRLK